MVIFTALATKKAHQLHFAILESKYNIIKRYVLIMCLSICFKIVCFGKIHIQCQGFIELLPTPGQHTLCKLETIFLSH